MAVLVQNTITLIRVDDGADGKSVASITRQYYISTSKIAPTGGSWTTTAPEWSLGKYLWTRYEIKYTNPASTVYTTAYCDSSWEAINEIQIGGRNLILDSAVEYSNTSYPTHIYTMSEKMSANETYTLRIWGELGEGKTHFAPYLDGGNIQLGSTVDNGDGTYSVTFTGKAGTKDPSTINIYPMPMSVTGVTSTITKVKLEKGNKATDWTPAPEDTALSIDEIHNQLDGVNNIITNTQTNFEQKIDSITASVSQTQEAIINYGDQLTQIRTDISTEIEQVASGLNLTIEEIYSQFSDLGGVTETIRTFFKVTSDGLMITQDGNPTATLMGYDHFAVLLNDSEVVKIYQDSMQAPNGIFDSSVTIGPIKFEGYSEGVALKWVG